MSAVSSPGVERGAAAGSTCSDPSTSWPLPVELLLQCLLASDMATRIRASHVCRTWREAVLAERRLWDSFACSRFRDKQHEDSMFSLLEAMLHRSRPLPFHLTVPHLDGRPGYDYTDRILSLEELDVFRLAAYHGPTRLFRLLNPTGAPLPNLLCLNVMRFPDDGDPDITTIDLTGQFGARCLPNLQELSAPNVRFPADGAPFRALRSITLEGIYGHHHRGLFKHCPLLVRLNIINSATSTLLPDPPLRPLLEEVSIGRAPSNELDLLALMEHWRGLRVRRLVARQVYSMEGVLSLFLASHERPIEMRLIGDEDEVTLATIPEEDCVWTISPSLDWDGDFLEDIENPASERLTSISVSFSRLGALFAARLDAPGLEQLELRLYSTGNADASPVESGDAFFLRAPRLRSVSFNLVCDGAASLENDLAVLRRSFRSLFLYDAELLDAIIVSRHAESVCVGFAPLAKEYTVLSGKC